MVQILDPAQYDVQMVSKKKNKVEVAPLNEAA